MKQKVWRMKIAKICKVAVIGAGNMAREHLRAFADVPGVVLAGIHSRTRSRAQALADQFGIPAVCDSVPALFERTRAQLVVVAVSETSTNEVSHACFQFPWTVLLEKPPGYNLKDALDIQSAASSHNSRVYVAMNRRSYASTRAVLGDINARKEIRYIKVQDQQSRQEALDSGKSTVVADNYMYANSIHLVDYFRIFGRGEVLQVKSVVPWDSRSPGIVISQLIFESGDIGLYEAVWNGPGPWAVTVSSPSKRWELRPLEQAAWQQQGKRQLTQIPSHVWDGDFKPGFRKQAEEAVKAALKEYPETLPTLDDILKTMRLVQTIYMMEA